MSDFYDTESEDADRPRSARCEVGPHLLDMYNGLCPGMRVVYQNPAWQQPDGTYKTAGMDPPLVITELVALGGDHVTAIINEGEWEVNADNLAPDLDLAISQDLTGSEKSESAEGWSG